MEKNKKFNKNMNKSINIRNNLIILFLGLCSFAFLLAGCNKSNDDSLNLTPQSAQVSNRAVKTHSNSIRGDSNTEINDTENSKVHRSKKTAVQNMVDINVELEENFGKMITYDVSYTSRQNPFMPNDEMIEYQKARASAIAQANERNANIIKMKNLQNVRVREQDDISPYDFNLPVPPTNPGPADSAASRITKTKVVGIMYNTKSPSAIINVDNKDYLVRPGDKIIGQEYIVTKINPTWVTAAMGANVYSASIGELFSKDGLEENQTDIYDLKNRFGGRKI